MKSLPMPNLIHEESLDSTTLKWQEGKLSNFAYLLYLNRIAGRSFGDLAQYIILCIFN